MQLNKIMIGFACLLFVFGLRGLLDNAGYFAAEIPAVNYRNLARKFIDGDNN